MADGPKPLHSYDRILLSQEWFFEPERVLPHLMSEDEATDFCPIVKLDEGQN